MPPPSAAWVASKKRLSGLVDDHRPSEMVECPPAGVTELPADQNEAIDMEAMRISEAVAAAAENEPIDPEDAYAVEEALEGFRKSSSHSLSFGGTEGERIMEVVHQLSTTEEPGPASPPPQLQPTVSVKSVAVTEARESLEAFAWSTARATLQPYAAAHDVRVRCGLAECCLHLADEALARKDGVPTTGGANQASFRPANALPPVIPCGWVNGDTCRSSRLAVDASTRADSCQTVASHGFPTWKVNLSRTHPRNVPMS